MRINNLALLLVSLLSFSATAANDVYGTVNELNIRSGDNGDNAIYFRLEVMEEYSTFENCISDGKSLVWQLDLSSTVLSFQYDILKKSYTEQLPVRITGSNDICSKDNVQMDKVFELSPWSWDYILADKTENKS